MKTSIPLLLLQINDALFPIGGYTQSYGLETYIQKGIVYDVDTARQYLYHNVQYNLKYTELLALALSYDCEPEWNSKRVLYLEQVLAASKSPREIRQASQKLGSRFMKTVGSMGAVDDDGFFALYRREHAGLPVNHCIAYGVFCASCHIDKQAAMMAYLYAAMSAAITVCVKSVPLSQTQGQKLLFDSHPLLEQVVEEALGLDESWLGLSAPGRDIRAMQHEELYSRLYMS